MMSFSQWLVEAKKKKGIKEPKFVTKLPLAPFFSPSSDQSGFNTLSSATNYSISDT